MDFKSKIKTIEWVDTYSKMVDQTVIPYEYKFVNITSGEEMFDAIRNMIVRGAPAIGIAGAHGVILYAQELEKENLSREDFVKELIKKAEYMKTSRPTAVNLMWACEKQIEVIKNSKSDIKGIIEELKQNGIKLENEDIEINKKIGDYGAEVVPKGATILTHCNAGALATVGYGTALGVVRSAYAKDNTIRVFADDAEVIRVGSTMMRTVIPFYFALCINQVLTGAIRGAGITTVPMMTAIFSFCIVRQIFLAVTMPIFNTVDLVFWSYALTWALCSVLLLIYYRKGHWMKRYES